MAVLYKQGRFTIAPAGAMCRNWAMTYEAVSAAHTAQNTSNERRIHEAPSPFVSMSSAAAEFLACVFNSLVAPASRLFTEAPWEEEPAWLRISGSGGGFHRCGSCF